MRFLYLGCVILAFIALSSASADFDYDSGDEMDAEFDVPVRKSFIDTGVRDIPVHTLPRSREIKAHHFHRLAAEGPASTQAPTEAAATQAPTTAAGTQAPTTAAGTQAPTTSSETVAPTTTAAGATAGTQAPTTASGTVAPTTAAATEAPTTASGTGAPATASGTQAPTTAAATASGTQAPTTAAGTTAATEAPATAAATQAPTTTASGTVAPTTAAATAAGTTAATEAPTTAAGTGTPTTAAATQAPTTASGTAAGTQAPSTSSPTTASAPKIDNPQVIPGIKSPREQALDFEGDKYVGFKWGYYPEQFCSVLGPVDWHSEFPGCSPTKRQQSPINIQTLTASSALNTFTLHYNTYKKMLVRNSFTSVSVFYGYRKELSEDSAVKYNEDTYRLVNVDFHSPSEHKLNGFQFPGEITFTHLLDKGLSKADAKVEIEKMGVGIKDLNTVDLSPKQVYETREGEKPSLLVVSVFLDLAPETHPELHIILQGLQRVRQAVEMEAGVADAWANPLKLYPLNGTGKYYIYDGSMTTPPCSAAIRAVMHEPMRISINQFLQLRSALPINDLPTVEGGNARPMFEHTGKVAVVEGVSFLLSSTTVQTSAAGAAEPATAAATQAPTTAAGATAATEAPATSSGTQAPTTAAATASGTQAPTTAAGTTAATEAPTTASATQAPTTTASATQAPTTASGTVAPTTAAATAAGTTAATEAPTTAAVTGTPVTASGTAAGTQAPTTASGTVAPTTAAATAATEAPTTAAGASAATEAPATAAATAAATEAPTTASGTGTPTTTASGTVAPTTKTFAA